MDTTVCLNEGFVLFDQNVQLCYPFDSLRGSTFLGDPCHDTIDNLPTDDILAPNAAGKRLDRQFSDFVSHVSPGQASTYLIEAVLPLT